MKKVYKIEVDCANCANLMEQSIQKIEGITNATVNYFAQKMTVEFTDGADLKAVMQAVTKACRKIEPDFEIEL